MTQMYSTSRNICEIEIPSDYKTMKNSEVSPPKSAIIYETNCGRLIASAVPIHGLPILFCLSSIFVAPPTLILGLAN